MQFRPKIAQNFINQVTAFVKQPGRIGIPVVLLAQFLLTFLNPRLVAGE